MTVIWGFDLSEMSWGAFRTRRMIDKRWHLRKERFIVYQLAMLICLVAECTGTYSLSKYQSLQGHIEGVSGQKASVYANDILSAEITAIVFCVLVATVFGANFFFNLFWPRRVYPRWVYRSYEISAVICTLGVFAAALSSTVIIARHSAYVFGTVGVEDAEGYIHLYYRPPLEYKRWPTNIAYVVLLWLGFLATIASTIVMFISARHDVLHGAEPKWEDKDEADSHGHDGDSPI